MSGNLPPSAAETNKKQRQIGKITDIDKPDMDIPQIKSRFPLIDRFLNIINCCKPNKDPVSTMLD